ncbi:MAG TPA: hypothetical protein PK280_04685 [Planctomycetota bacterium]|nr:hypothetical protein [Planctomycetota bacterium]
MRTLLTILASLLISGFAPAAEGGAGQKLEMIERPDAKPPEPAKRGSDYKFNSGRLDARSMWGWRLELPDSSGLAFGGIATWTMQEMNGALVRSDDPAVRTQVRRDGKWVFIHEELRKKNPLQPHHDRLEGLVRPLKLVTGLARHIYFEGRDEAAEKAFVEKEIAPKAAELLGKLKDARAELAKAGASDDKYAAGQAAFALGFLDKVAPAVEGLGTRTSHEKLLALRLARVALEQAAEALDAEPPARALSMPAYDAKSGLFAIFGGDHLDYMTNDLWVFDPKAPRWMQRHPKSAPEPRADHTLTSDGQGRLTMRGGYLYQRTPRPQGWASNSYVHAGPGDWVYDLAADAWTGPADPPMLPPATRGYRDGGHLPEHFTAGERPDAAAHAKTLAALPANTWVDLKPSPKFAGNRDWGTLGWDAERDMIYFYNGGHSAYAGTDVAHYHLATGRWDQPVEVEYPLMYIGASGSSVPGWSFNRRPWVTNHLWNSYRYHPGLKRLVVAGRYTSPCWPKGWGNPDVNLYLYDPDLADWEKRVPNNVEMSCMGAQILHVPGLGMIEWGNWLLDDAKLEWKKLGAKGKLPGAGIDFCGFTNDPKRNRVLFFSGGEYSGKPYSGEVFAMAVPSLEVTSFKPEGSEHIKATYAGRENCLGTWVLREVVYHPGLDMFLFSSNLPGGYTAALDVKGNRWVGLKLPGPHPFGLSSAMAYDARRDLIYSVGTRADVSALRIDPKTVEIKTLAEIVAEAPPPQPRK